MREWAGGRWVTGTAEELRGAGLELRAEIHAYEEDGTVSVSTLWTPEDGGEIPPESDNLRAGSATVLDSRVRHIWRPVGFARRW